MRLPYSLTSSGGPGFHRRSVLLPTVVTIRGRGLVVAEYNSLLLLTITMRSSITGGSGPAWIESWLDSRVHLIGAAAWAIRYPPRDRAVDVVDLGEIAHTVIRARHYPDQGLALRRQVAERVPSLPCEFL